MKHSIFSGKGICVVFFIAAMVLLSQNLAAQGGDTTPPELNGYDFTPKTIDVTPGSQDVVFDIEMTDDYGLFTSGGQLVCWGWFRSPSGQQNMGIGVYSNDIISGSETHGLFRIILTFPQTSEEGTWTISNLYLYDAVGNTRSLDTNDLMTMGLPTKLEVINPFSDITPPELITYDYNPKAVDVTAEDQEVVFDIEMTDDYGLFTSGGQIVGWGWFRSPSGQQDIGIGIYSNDFVSGDETHAFFSVRVNFPQNSEEGTWTISNLYLYDAVRNTLSLNTNDLIARGLPTEIEVINLFSDITPPELITYDYDPKAIDTSSEDQDIIFDIEMTDDYGLFTSGGQLVCWGWFRSPSGQQNVGIGVYSDDMISGYETHATFRVKPTFPHNCEEGTWKISDLHLYDAVHNVLSLDHDTLKAMGFNTEIDVGPLNDPPSADAGPDQTIMWGETVTLDGSGSSDPDGYLVSYEWDFGDNSQNAEGAIITHEYTAPGTYTATLTVTDDYGASAIDEVSITVHTPGEAVEDLGEEIEALDLPAGIENSLISLLDNALESLNGGKDDTAVNKLNALINHVEAQSGKKIPEEEADGIIATVQRIIASILSGQSTQANLLSPRNPDAISPSKQTDHGNRHYSPGRLIGVDVKEPGTALIEIRNEEGCIIRILSYEYDGSGKQMIFWDGKDNLDQFVPSGHYVCRILLNNKEIGALPIHIKNRKK